MVRVLIVDDSRVTQEFLKHVFSYDPSIEVVGFAGDGSEVLELINNKHPDVITMDIHMHRVNGYDATRLIMENAPTPIVVVSESINVKEETFLFKALEAGALAVVARPSGIGSSEHAAGVRELIRTVKMMSEIKLVRRLAKPPIKNTTEPNYIFLTPNPRKIELIAIGASTGGPPVLLKILSLLPPDLPVPVLIVQHISPGFVESFTNWLSRASQFPLHIAEHGQQTKPGHGYVAPDGFHMGIGSDKKIELSNHPPENGLRPSVDHLFRSAQKFGTRAVGVLLTGMGKDGAAELKAMKDAGAFTIAQDEDSSVVFGMPGEAVKIGAASCVLAPEEIGNLLNKLVARAKRGSEK